MINVITLFSGYDSQCLALRRLGVEFDLVAWSEIDPAAIKAHNALFPEYSKRNLGDITCVDWQEFRRFHPDNIDILTYSSPCQDFSQAGRQRGGEQGSGTRSSLLWEVERAVDAFHPKYLLMENVAALVGEKFMPLFQRWLARLQRHGYNNYWQEMNAKDFGVPQNRKRVFVVSKFTEADTSPYYFPLPFRLESRLRDVLENDVAERYYLSDAAIARITRNLGGRDIATTTFGISKTIVASCAKITSFDNYVKVGNLYASESSRQSTKTYHVNEDGSILARYIGRDERSHPISEEQYTSPDAQCMPTLTLSNFGKIIDRRIQAAHSGREQGKQAATIRVRRLTERELYRLMDVDEHDIDTLLASGISNTQHARLAGNSIVVSCLYHIFDTLLLHPEPRQGQQLKLF